MEMLDIYERSGKWYVQILAHEIVYRESGTFDDVMPESVEDLDVTACQTWRMVGVFDTHEAAIKRYDWLKARFKIWLENV